MTLQALQVGLGALQHPGIGRAVRLMAGLATLCLDRQMFEDKWPGFVHMALKADLVLVRSGPQLLWEEPSVLIVAVGALNQPLLDAVSKGPVEVLLDVGMAAIAEFRLFGGEQELRLFGVMRGVAGYAAYVVGVVLRTTKVGVLFAVLVAGQTAVADFLGGGAIKSKDLALVAAAFHVSFSRPMASFAALPPRTFLAEGGFPVWRGFVVFYDIFVAGLASFHADIKVRIRGTRVRGLVRFWLRLRFLIGRDCRAWVLRGGRPPPLQQEGK
jgi:hypothetical protein